MLTMGFALVFRDAAFIIWGGDPFTLPYPPGLRGSVEAASIVFPVYRLFVMAVAGGVGVLLWFLNEKTLDRRETARRGGRSRDGRRHRHQRRAVVRPWCSPPAPGWRRSAA